MDKWYACLLIQPLEMQNNETKLETISCPIVQKQKTRDNTF